MIGVTDSKKLLEEIPNKIQTTMGIIADVNLLSEAGKDYIEIDVRPSSYPVSYKGEYHYRSGSTKQQLRGASLTEFLVSKTGFKWDAIPVDNIGIDDLDKESFDIFRREAMRSGRMSKEDLDMSNAELLDSLGLIVDGKLKRAAVMLFYRKPERFVTGSYVKIGKFGEGADLQYQDEIHGSLFIIADRVIELIYLKYLKAAITYDKEIRIETYPFPRDGIREAVFNALMHCNWADCVPIQIRIEDDAMYISNSCVFPSDWTTETLMERHRSKPYNPDIANAFFRAGYVEVWGRGIQKICEACKRLGTEIPEYKVRTGEIMVKFLALQSAKIPDLKSPNRQNGDLDGGLDAVLENKILVIIQQNPEATQKEISQETNISLRTVQRKLRELREKGIIERKGGKRFGFWEIYKRSN